MKKQPGYPLPAGELGEDEIVCQLVYLPDRPEYWQAFLGALHYMTTWRAWERDVDRRGKDAAANWRAAFELTMECWRMTCLDDLKSDVAAILAIMEIPQSCCDAGDVTDGDQYTDRVEDGEGDVPQPIIDAGYADDAADWDGFDDYKCMIAHVIVDQLVGRLNEISPLVSATGGVLGGVAALAGILAVIFGTGGLAIVFGIVAGIGATSLLYQAITDFDIIDGLADKVEDNHEELACAVYFSDGDDDALSALNDKIDELFTVAETLILKNMNLGPTLKSLYAGRYDQQDIADILLGAGYDVGDFDCSCIIPEGEYQLEYDFEGGFPAVWDNNGLLWHATNGRDGTAGVRATFNLSGHMELSTYKMGLETLGYDPPEGTEFIIHSFSFWYKHWNGLHPSLTLQMNHDGGLFQYTLPYVTDWTYYTTVFGTPLTSTDFLAEIVKLQVGTGTGGNYVYWDDIYIDVDVVEP